MSPRDKPLAWLRGEIKTPPFSANARIETGFLLRGLLQGESLGMPHSRPMPDIGTGCHELRIVDDKVTWRIMYHIGADAVVILDVFQKRTEATPKTVIKDCRLRLEEFHRVVAKKKDSSHAKR
jgi:phage-related protein